MTSKHAWRALIAACFFFLVPVFAAEEAPLSMYVGGQLVIGKDGHVRTYAVNSDKPAVKALVERSVQQWLFEPVMRDGTPIEARTGFTLKLVATPVDNGYAVRVSEPPSFFVPRKFVSQSTLPSPEIAHAISAARQDIDILAALRVDRDGNVVDAAVLAVQARDGAVLRIRGLDSWLVRRMKAWKAEPAQPTDSTRFEGLITLRIRAGDRRDALAEWRAAEFKDRKPIPWSDAPVDTSQLKEGQLVAQDPAVKLKTPLAGTVL